MRITNILTSVTNNRFLGKSHTLSKILDSFMERMQGFAQSLDFGT